MRVLAFSGGKDSMACLHLCKQSIDCAIYVDTGKSYPEAVELVRYAESIVPVITVQSNQEEQNQREGIPADIVPIDWTRLGQLVTGPKPVTVQSYLSCCYENIAFPLFLKAKELGATEIVYGQRNNEGHRSPSRNGDVVGGITRLHPIENWTSEDVLAYLRTVMDVPGHYYYLEHSSLDCYDCTAYRANTRDRVSFTKDKYPEFHKEYQARMVMIRNALEQSGYVEREHA